MTDEVTADGRLIVGADILTELRWTWTGRRGWLAGIGINLLVGSAYVVYTHYKPGAPLDVTTVSGVSIGIVLFVLSDTINTNQLGPEADRVIALMNSGVGIVRVLFVKNVALLSLLLPLALILSALLRIVVGEQRTIVSACLLDLYIVLGWLGFGNIASVLAPYRTFPIKQRLRMRNTWLWWVFVQAVPYIIYFLRAWIILAALNEILRQSLHKDPKDVLDAVHAVEGLLVLALSYGFCALYGRFANNRLKQDLAKQR